jgi:hypothetical protein
LFVEDEVFEPEYGPYKWVIERKALHRVRREALSRGRGAFNGKDVKCPLPPKGYVAVALNELTDPLLVAAFFGHAENYKTSYDVLGPYSPRVMAVRKKLFELRTEMTRRNLRPLIPDDIKRIFFD